MSSCQAFYDHTKNGGYFENKCGKENGYNKWDVNCNPFNNLESDYKKYFDYSLNRWFNFWSAQAVEKIFCSLPNVQPALDEKDKLVDFTIDGVKFDHKTSIFPKNFPYPINEAVKKTDELIKQLNG